MELTAGSVEYRAGAEGPKASPPVRDSRGTAPATGCARAARPRREELTMATITRQAPVLPALSGRAGFGGTLRSELTKIGSVRSTYWTLLVLFAVSVGLGAAISAVVATDWSQPWSPVRRRTFTTPPRSASSRCWSSASSSSWCSAR